MLFIKRYLMLVLTFIIHNFTNFIIQTTCFYLTNMLFALSVFYRLYFVKHTSWNTVNTQCQVGDYPKRLILYNTPQDANIQMLYAYVQVSHFRKESDGNYKAGVIKFRFWRSDASITFKHNRPVDSVPVASCGHKFLTCRAPIFCTRRSRTS